WVINSFNRNKPFDEFTVEQLAGDLLPNPTRDQKTASGFHRNVMTNDEGGADPAEYLAKYIVDRVNTTATVWLGTTIGCAECHDHKYDRIRQKDFYQLYAFFHNVPESGLDGTRTENPRPRMMIPTQDQEQKLSALDQSLPQAEKLVKSREAELPAAQHKWEQIMATSLKDAREPQDALARFTFDETLEGEIRGSKLLGVYKSGPTNTPVYGSGKLGKGLKLDGQGAYIEAGREIAFDYTNAFSFGCWTKFKEKGGAILSKMDDGADFRGFDLLIEEGKPTVHIISKWPDNAIKVTAKQALPKDIYQHIFVTYDGSRKAKGVKVYANGKEIPLEVKTDKLSASITNSLPFHIGKRSSSLPYQGSIDDLRCYSRALKSSEVEALAQGPQLALLAVPEEKRSPDQKKELAQFFKQNYAADLKQAEEALAKLKADKDALLKIIPNTMVMEELPKPRDTFIFVRGNFQAKGEKVAANVPAFLPALAPGLPTNRLGLAQWLVSRENPLPARVNINRLWATFFGTGIVKTVNDFGSQGDWPSHPELLDWLATEFMDSHWDIKHMVKLMVMSATYRQSSAVNPKQLEKDPYNRLLSRGPRLRLDAEFIRDNALAVSGLLNDKIGGESVRPYQPSGLWEVTDRKYEQSKGEDLYRRGMYVYWKRAVHYPSFATFDAPNREVCTVQRPRTSTPLQSLVLMNDPVYVEAARTFAARILKEGGAGLTEQLTYAFRLVLARKPTAQELKILEQTYNEQVENYKENQKAASDLIAIGESPKPKGDPVQLAALTGVANVLLNLSETITK
ncbi:MAG: Planctomycete cytochrome, partial [Verrucomicrobiales bacterium]|nr:Planctomycete cytochrome [Verrucomicrobiales bacterium]